MQVPKHSKFVLRVKAILPGPQIPQYFPSQSVITQPFLSVVSCSSIN